MTLECYARPGTRFGEAGPFYTPVIGHRGQDYYVGTGGDVCAYEDMVIEYSSRTTGLGLVLGARLLSDNSFAGWAHLRNLGGFVNGLVRAGQKFAEVAGAGDGTGTLWAGAHIHTTLVPPTSSASAAANGNMPLYDPAPRIRVARERFIHGSASAASIQRMQGDADMKLIQDPNRIGVVGPGYHKTLTPEEYEVAKVVWGAPTVFASRREYDLARAAAVNGETALVTVRK